MIATFRSGCSDDSVPDMLPAPAKADGAPGPNVCKNVQDVIFMQTGAQTAEQ